MAFNGGRGRGFACALGLLASVAYAAGCGKRPNFDPAYTAPGASGDDPFYNWAAHPLQIEQRLGSADLEVRTLEPIGDGTSAARKARLRFADGTDLVVKWKEFLPELDGWNNSPRRELAAYEIQKWFLRPEEYVVPTTAVRCVTPEQITGAPITPPTVAGSRCTLVVLALWLRHVRSPTSLYQARRFETNAGYAFHVANFNVLATLIDNRDSRGSNVLVSDREPMRIYSVDNGMSFDPWFWKFNTLQWNRIVVPALPRITVDRLRAVPERDYDALLVLAQMLLGDSGVYQNVEPTGPPIDPDRGVRRAGRLLQLGLTREEIREVRERVRSIIDQVDRGEIPTF